MLYNCLQGESVDVNEHQFTASCHDKESLSSQVSVPYCYVFYSCSWLVSGVLMDSGSGPVVKLMPIKIFYGSSMLFLFQEISFCVFDLFI